jgi:hypothetical protein
MKAYCAMRYARDGVSIPDSAKAQARRKYRLQLTREFGTADVDPECQAKMAIPIDEEIARRFTGPAQSEFGSARQQYGLASMADNLVGIAAARAAMHGAPAPAAAPAQEVPTQETSASHDDFEPDWDAVAGEAGAAF